MIEYIYLHSAFIAHPDPSKNNAKPSLLFLITLFRAFSFFIILINFEEYYMIEGWRGMGQKIDLQVGSNLKFPNAL